MDTSLSKLREVVKDRKPGARQSMGSQRLGQYSATGRQELIYKVVLVSAVQQSYIFIYILLKLFSFMVYHRMLNMVPYATQ